MNHELYSQMIAACNNDSAPEAHFTPGQYAYYNLDRLSNSLKKSCFSLQPGHYSSLTAPNQQPTVNQEPNDQCGFSLQPGHYSSLTAPNLQPTVNQEPNDQCGNQHYSRELLMMGIVVPETCRAASS